MTRSLTLPGMMAFSRSCVKSSTKIPALKTTTALTTSIPAAAAAAVAAAVTTTSKSIAVTITTTAAAIAAEEVQAMMKMGPKHEQMIKHPAHW